MINIEQKWNKQADEFIQWVNLSESEKIEFAYKLGKNDVLEEAAGFIDVLRKDYPALHLNNKYSEQVARGIRLLKGKRCA